MQIWFDWIHCLVGIDHDELVKLAEKHFSSLRSSYTEDERLSPCRFTGSEVRHVTKISYYEISVKSEPSRLHSMK